MLLLKGQAFLPSRHQVQLMASHFQAHCAPRMPSSFGSGQDNAITGQWAERGTKTHSGSSLRNRSDTMRYSGKADISICRDGITWPVYSGHCFFPSDCSSGVCLAGISRMHVTAGRPLLSQTQLQCVQLTFQQPTLAVKGHHGYEYLQNRQNITFKCECDGKLSDDLIAQYDLYQLSTIYIMFKLHRHTLLYLKLIAPSGHFHFYCIFLL